MTSTQDEQLREAIRATEYKYFGDYEMSESQRKAVDVLVAHAEASLALKADDRNALASLPAPDTAGEVVEIPNHDPDHTDCDGPSGGGRFYHPALIRSPQPTATGGETFETIRLWCDETFGPASIEKIIERAKEEFAELEEPGADHAIEAADVCIILCRIPGFDEALQRKMRINRNRRWAITGEGTGYHIKDEPALHDDVRDGRG